jgi:glutathione S-transferase
VAAASLHSELSRIEESVEENLWLGGDNISAADIIGHSDLEFLLRIVGGDEVKRLKLGYDDMEYRYPSITAWRNRMTCIEGYDKAYPPHWRTS